MCVLDIQLMLSSKFDLHVPAARPCYLHVASRMAVHTYDKKDQISSQQVCLVPYRSSILSMIQHILVHLVIQHVIIQPQMLIST